MNAILLRQCAVAGIIMAAGSACGKSPTRPSAQTLAPASPTSVTLSNLRGTYVGLSRELCKSANDTMAIDHLSLDYQASGATLNAALLIACDTADCISGVPLGTVAACPVSPDPCDVTVRQALSEGTAPACLTGDPTRTGSLHILAARPWEPANTWNLTAFFEASGDRTNVVSAIVEHPQKNLASPSEDLAVRK